MTVQTELENAPFTEIIRKVGIGIAEAQYELDLVSMKIARMMAGYMPDPEPDQGNTPSVPDNADRNFLVKIGDGNADGYSLLELGFTPTFYQFVDTLIEIKMSFSVTKESNFSGSTTHVQASVKAGWSPFSAGGRMSASVVSARYSNKYQYSAEGSSLVRTKLVPVPAPAVLEEKIRAMLTGTIADQ